METQEIVILVLFLGIIAHFFLVPKFEAFSNEVSIILTSFIEIGSKLVSNSVIYLYSWQFYAILGVILLPLFSYLNYKIIKGIVEWRRDVKYEKESIMSEKAYFRNIIKKDVNGLDYSDMKNFIESLERGVNSSKEQRYLNEFTLLLKDKLDKTRKIFLELMHKENIKNLESETRELEEKDEYLDQQIRRKERILEDRNDAILRDLQIYGNPVFKKDVLTNKEYGLLLKNGYEQINQYCVFEKKMITVLVRKISNHSLTHIFLVWSVMKLLKKYRKISHIKEHLSIDADITFEYESECYAIEVETGTLLSKKEQIDEKIKYLNRKYPDRWLIIVSNKNLLWKYKKLGNACTRNEAIKNLEKMLKMPQN